MGTVTFMRGKEWWLLKRGHGKTRRLHYPNRILVGELDKPRVYLPERTCRNDNDNDNDPSRFTCSECGWEDWDTYTADSAFSYCPNCGAKVVE